MSSKDVNHKYRVGDLLYSRGRGGAVIYIIVTTSYEHDGYFNVQIVANPNDSYFHKNQPYKANEKNLNSGGWKKL
jgi:hypothetical protein